MTYVPIDRYTHMTTSTPPAWQWHWINECDVPVTTAEESSVVANDSPDPTYQDCRPSARYLSDGPDDGTPESAWAHMASQVGATVKEPLTVDQCSECRCAPGQPHAPGCERTAQLTDAHSNAAPSHRIGTRSLDPLTGEYVMQGDFFDGSTELRWSGSRHDAEPVATAESCPECGTVTNIEYGALMEEGYREMAEDSLATAEANLPDTFSVPFAVQSWLFESLCEVGIAKLHNLIDDHHDLIIELARARFRDGYKMHGSKMYSWSPERRLDETLCEVADAVVYPTSGPLE